ncbi:ATP-binding protein [Planktothrix agardhii]|uniref:Putative ATPase (AAA+ superfamily) n=1 Tax=Planktothrix agardhii (strain NIVA-CYA 126/8) TaxID=388467 RepID=A0A073CMA8_PLAA1|nr:DUF499 domain-containing protein [Planktothrix agardhii]KEI65125.1 putative ATPase (AAA+ superfamily) [Planktothrix agardhii NIVA-CYA 126/8]MCB8780055.1 DUF499 domain-containing protein [Planktothrix agardhii 1031]MCF3600589.1 DUF499 domain-containing protein [Planktothrix agardhii 1032]CAD5985362.1 Putative ATPase (AAA+ superfamily) [Planktothrix agardhii]
MTAYQLKPWTQVVTPHPDILDGKLDNATYAANLGSVIRQEPKCPRLYRDAREFFNATYLTGELRGILADVLKGLQGDAGNRVIQLRTPFGGGKTHTLLSLYHLAKHRDQLRGIPQLDPLPDPGDVTVAAFIGLDISASTGISIENGPQILTPWGYLAWQIGGNEAYQLIEADDKNRTAPGNNDLRKIIGDKPTLILMDEFLVYVENAMGIQLGDSTFGRQVLTFVQKLTEVVRELPKTVLVYSLQASVQEAVGNEGLLSVLDKLVSRIDAKKEPVSGDEVMEVVRKRLFTDIGNTEIIAEVARQQAALFRKFRESYTTTNREKQEVEQQAKLLEERIKLSYPFHPDLLDLMYHRWGSLPSYQRTRGALQFLASMVYALREKNDRSWLISPGNILFDHEAVRSAFFSQVGERDNYSAVMAADLIGRKAKVNFVDQRIAQDVPTMSSLKVGSRLASAILMYSFGARGGEERGVFEQEIVGACLAPGLDRNTIVTVLNDLREELLYLHYVGQRYRFETKANLNKLVTDEENKIAGDDVLERIQGDLKNSLKNAQGKVVLWPKDSSAIPDHINQFCTVYLDSSWAEKSTEALQEDGMKWLENRGNDKRDYKNAIAFVIPNAIQFDKARKSARTLLAVNSLVNDKEKYKFSVEDLDELKAKAKDATSSLDAGLRRLYEQILLPLRPQEQAPIRLEMVDLQSQINTSQNLQDRVLDALKSYVFNSITVSKIISYSKINESEIGVIQGDELISYFFRFPGYPKLLSDEPIKKAILGAIADGSMGYVPKLKIVGDSVAIDKPELISFNRHIPADELDLSGYLLAPRIVEQFQQKSPIIEPENDENQLDSINYSDSLTENTGSKVAEQKPTVEYKSANSSLTRTVLADIVDGKQAAKRYTLSSVLNKAQVFEFFEMLQRLSDKADDMSIEIKIKAFTKGEFDPNWIRNAIEEPLDEMDIQANTKLE